MEHKNENVLGDAASGPRSTVVPSETDRATPAPLIAIAPAHTPGPWVVNEARRELVGRTEHFIASVRQDIDNYRGEVCHLQSCDHIKGITMDECEANARLIAAAPDYHAAVEQMIAYEQAGGDGWWKGFEMLKAAHANPTNHK